MPGSSPALELNIKHALVRAMADANAAGKPKDVSKLKKGSHIGVPAT